MSIVVEEPDSPRSEDNEHSEPSKLALLLALGVLYGATEREGVAEDILKFREEIELPNPLYGERRQTQFEVSRFIRRYGISPFFVTRSYDLEVARVQKQRRQISAEVIDQLYKQPNRESAVDLLLLGLGDSNDIRRVASAISLMDIFTNIGLVVQELVLTLENTSDELASRLAEIALKRFGNFRSAERRSPLIITPNDNDEKIGLIVHGSRFAWAGEKPEKWWRPGGDFHNYIKDNFLPNLYSRSDHFFWSGGWNDIAREMAANDLSFWVQNRNFQGLDILAHSHGGNVVLRATQLGLEIDRLTLMSCPVHWSHYQPNFSNVKAVTSYQINLDLVILADRGRHRFDHSKIEDKFLPVWFWQHSDTHKPHIWEQNGLKP